MNKLQATTLTLSLFVPSLLRAAAVIRRECAGEQPVTIEPEPLQHQLETPESFCCQGPSQAINPRVTKCVAPSDSSEMGAGYTVLLATQYCWACRVFITRRGIPIQMICMAHFQMMGRACSVNSSGVLNTMLSVSTKLNVPLIQIGCIKCRRHISVECIQLYN
jgi:hypothetical protein